jgi:hypothetical protein
LIISTRPKGWTERRRRGRRFDVDTSVRDLVTEYVQTVGERRFDRLGELMHPDVTFGGIVKQEAHGREAVVNAFRTVGPIIRRNDIRAVVVDGNDAFVLYDFVTDTDVGAVLSGEYVTTEDGLIRSTTLLYDLRRWPEVLQELERRRNTVGADA